MTIRHYLLFSILMFGVCGCSEFGHNKLNLRKGTSSLDTPLAFNYFNTNAPNYYQKRYDSPPGGEDKKSIRNHITREVMDVVDKDFNKFKISLRSDYAYKEIVVKLISLGLSGAGSFAAQHTANVLAAIDTGLKGANDAVNLKAWANDAPEILINQMVALRDPIKAQI